MKLPGIRSDSGSCCPGIVRAHGGRCPGMNIPGSIHEPGSFVMSLSERGVCSRALQAGGRPCPRPLFPEPVPPYVAQAKQQFAYGEAFLPGYLDFPEGDPAVGAGYAEQRAAVAFDAAGFFAVGGGFESG